MNLNDKIRELRINKKLSQKELADALGCESSSTISMWESGDRTPPTSKIVLLAEILGTNCDYLLNSESPGDTA